MKKHNNIPTFVVAGESAAAKSATIAKMAEDSYYKGMESLIGEGMTTSCETAVIIDPEEKYASIQIEMISEDEINANLLRNIQTALVPEVRNVVSSLPANNTEALEKFIYSAVEARAKLPDEKFRIHKLLVNKQGQYYDYLSQLFRIVFKKAAEKTFRDNCIEAGKESKSKATGMIEDLISNMLENDTSRNIIEHLIDLIKHEILLIQTTNNLFLASDDSRYYECCNLDPEQFMNTIRVISNSEKKELKEIPSIACALKSVKIIVPGFGIADDGDKLTAYQLIDIVGFTNDGLGNVDQLINKAVLSQYNYDGIIYLASIKTINKTHESFLSEIFKSMRPAKLIILSTFMDKDSIFDEEEPNTEMILELNDNRIGELLGIVKRIATDDLHIMLPSKEDVICISNKVNVRKHGEAACAIYGAQQYTLIREALSRATKTIRRKIYSGVDRTARYMVSDKPIEEIVGQLINQLGTSIDQEYSMLRDSSSLIHHWTLDAILWKLLEGYEHVSNAKVWMNVHINTFSNMQQICLDNFGRFRFSADFKVGREEDSKKIINEFMANLCTQLYWGVRDIILIKPDSKRENSCYKDKIRELALQSKYNKWRIIDELRLNLMKAVVQREYLEQMINSSISNALIMTYDKLLY